MGIIGEIENKVVTAMEGGRSAPRGEISGAKISDGKVSELKKEGVGEIGRVKMSGEGDWVWTGKEGVEAM